MDWEKTAVKDQYLLKDCIEAIEMKSATQRTRSLASTASTSLDHCHSKIHNSEVHFGFFLSSCSEFNSAKLFRVSPITSTFLIFFAPEFDELARGCNCGLADTSFEL